MENMETLPLIKNNSFSKTISGNSTCGIIFDITTTYSGKICFEMLFTTL